MVKISIIVKNSDEVQTEQVINLLLTTRMLFSTSLKLNYVLILPIYCKDYIWIDICG